jgi:hypothetical protein
VGDVEGEAGAGEDLGWGVDRSNDPPLARPPVLLPDGAVLLREGELLEERPEELLRELDDDDRPDDPPDDPPLLPFA